MVEQRLEWESKKTEKVQYIRNGKLETETGIWNQKWSARELKQNNKNWNAVEGLRDWSELSEIGDIVSEVLEDGRNEVGGVIGDQSWIGWGSWYLTMWWQVGGEIWEVGKLGGRI